MLTFPLQNAELWIGLISKSLGPQTPPASAAAQAGPAALTFLTVLAFVARGAHTVPINAGAVAPAGRIDALIHGHITLRAFPAAVALARPFRILSVPTAQDGAGSCKNQRQSTRSQGAVPEELSPSKKAEPTWHFSFACNILGWGLWSWRCRADFK